MIARLERILIKLAHQYTPYVFSNGALTSDSVQRVHYLSRQLAKHGVLVTFGYPVGEDMQQRRRQIEQWVSAYAELYLLLTQRLFLSQNPAGAVYADNDQDQMPIVVMTGDLQPVICALAEFVVPYAALRQPPQVATTLEMEAVLRLILEDLEATDMARHDFDILVKQGAEILRKILQVRLQQLWVRDFDLLLFRRSPELIPAKSAPPQPDELPEHLQPPAADPVSQNGDSLPDPTQPVEEETQPTLPSQFDFDPPLDEEETPTEELFRSPIPMFFNPERRNGDKKKKPGLFRPRKK